jgi:Tol biopolymer transport system component
MKTTSVLSGIVVAVLLACLQAAPDDKKADVLLQAAMAKETVQGDLKGAMDLYRKALKEAGANRQLAAKALLHLAQCYEKQGDAEARKLYERVVRDFGDQKDPAETARTRLAALGRAGAIGQPSGITLRKVWALDHGWLQGSPSPDGRYHSFLDFDTGDLALRDLVTGQNRRITNKGSWKDSKECAEASVISGDGKQIAYAWYNKEKFYELRVSGIDGSNPRTVYRDKEVGHWLEPYQWTADGKQILAVVMRSKKEWQCVFIPAAGGPVRVIDTPSKGPWHPSLSPDGRFLVYGAWRVNGRDSDIFLLSLEGGQEVPLVRSPAEDINPVWTPTGDKVLFVSDRTGTRGFWAVDVVDGKPRGVPQLVKDGVTGVGSPIRPNGFTRGGDFYFSTSTEIGEVYVTELDPVEGKTLRQPAPVAPRFVGSNSAPSWSPDGRLLAYYRRGDNYDEKPPTLVILSVETGEERDVPVRLAQEILAPVRWFPDGKSVLVSARDSPKRDQVAFYRVDAQTGDHRLVRESPGPGPVRAELSPDGKTLFFFTGGEQKLWGGLISRDIETGQEREIARVPFMRPANGWTEPAVSPDGKYLAFRSPVDESWRAVRLVPTTGGEVRELYRFQVQSEPALFGELSWTPDGRNVLFVGSTGKDGMPELWRMPIAGGEPQRTGLSAKGMRIVAAHPDGRRIAFDTGTRSGSPNELWVLENFLPKPAK